MKYLLDATIDTEKMVEETLNPRFQSNYNLIGHAAQTALHYSNHNQPKKQVFIFS